MSEETRDLRKAGLKVTLPRLRILELLETAEQKHMTADEIHRALMDQGEEIGLATVYRVLNQFETAGLVKKHMFDDGSGRPPQACFELDEGSHHDHMVDLESGEVVEFVDDEIERRQEQIAHDHGYEIVDHSLVIYVRPRRKS